MPLVLVVAKCLTIGPYVERAYKLLESLAEQIGSLQSAENRARMADVRGYPNTSTM